MSIRVMNWVWENSPAKGTELLLLLAIADAADDQGTNAFPSINTLAKKTRLSRRTVQRLVNHLEAAGMITVRQAGGRDSNRYTVLVADAQTPSRAAETLSTPAVDKPDGESPQPPQSPSESTGGVNLTPRQSDTGDTAMTLQGRHSYDTPGVTQLCHPTPPITVLYPSTTAQPVAPSPAGHGGGGGEDDPNNDDQVAGPPADLRTDVEAINVLEALGPHWRLGDRSTARLAAQVSHALTAGWTAEQLVTHLGASPEGVRSPYAVLKARLRDLPEPPARHQPRPPWCGHCHQPTRLIETDTGAKRCPDCHPAIAHNDTNPLRRTS